MPEIITNTEQETFALGKDYVANLRGGEIIALSGDLGAGKTVFAKGLAAGLGVKQTITSPTFVIMKIYETSKIKNQKSNVAHLVHIDAYRLRSEADLEAIGATDYFERKDTVMVIEWAEKIQNLLPTSTNKFAIIIKNNKRIIKQNYGNTKIQ